MLNKVCLITATKNRHKCLERVVKFVLNQTSNDWVHLIFNNASEALRLNTNLSKEKFILINNSLSYKTGKHYISLGEIYNDIIRHIPEDIRYVNFMDDDDIFLPNHVEEGLKGLERGGKKAYKPKKSYYRYLKKLVLAENVLEPSIFVEADHIRKYGFSDETTAQHHKWLSPLQQNGEIFIDEYGPPTFICDWSQEIRTFKTSGDPDNPNNFNNYTHYSNDKGDGIITPCSQSWAQHYYNYVR